MTDVIFRLLLESDELVIKEEKMLELLVAGADQAVHAQLLFWLLAVTELLIIVLAVLMIFRRGQPLVNLVMGLIWFFGLSTAWVSLIGPRTLPLFIVAQLIWWGLTLVSSRFRRPSSNSGH
jgi:hypothetical protein